MKYILIFLALCLVGCGPAKKRPSVNCTVENTFDGALITCPDGSSALITSGLDGKDGERGPLGPTGAPGAQGEAGPAGRNLSVEAVDPCPELVTSFPEYLFLIEGTYYAVYASGTKIHLARLVPGAYATTDGRACSFSINSAGELIH